jgi:DNA-binding transcriptional regulator YiaG
MTPTTPVESTSLNGSATADVLVQTDSKGRLRISKEQREAVLAKFEQSRMSAAKFAAVAGIKYSTLAGWLQRYRRAKPRVASKQMRLVEAVIGTNPSPEGRSGLVLHLPGSVRVELSSIAEVPLAAALIKELQNRAVGC